MPTSIDDNAAAREAVLERVRKALKRRPKDVEAAQASAAAYVAEHRHGPRPQLGADLVARFIERATYMESTVERLQAPEQIPGAVARYLDGLQLPPSIAEQKSHAGVCWPAFADLDWRGAGLAIEPRPTSGSDRLGITGALCAIAETGTLVVVSSPATPTATTLLPDTHVAVLSARDILPGMEEAFERIRAFDPAMPRAVHLISGPSRTGDIEQTIVLGAHGPYRVHILLLP
jgi:L-lactate dehydrogenase complex protein LldG